MISYKCLECIYNSAQKLVHDQCICTNDELWIYYYDMNRIVLQHEGNDSILRKCIEQHVQSYYGNSEADFQTIPVLVVIIITATLLCVL